MLGRHTDVLTQPGPGARKPETAHRLYTAGGRGEGGEQLSKSRCTRTLEEHVPPGPWKSTCPENQWGGL